MVRTILVLILAAVLLMPSSARSDFNLSEDQARRLMDEYKTAKGQLEAVQKQLDEIREQMIKMQRSEQVLKEELIRRGVDVDQLLAPPATQADTLPPVLIFESPEAMGEYMRENFSQRVRADMTQLQREVAVQDFNSWMNSAALLPTQVTWVFKVTDVWRATTPDQVGMTYFSDRQPLSSTLPKLNRSLDEIEMLELNIARLKIEQKARSDRYDQRKRELHDAPPTHKQLAERVMKQAYDKLVEINVRVRAAEARYSRKKTPSSKTLKATSQSDRGAYRIMMHARGARDDTIELNVFCHEQDANRLMAAPKNSLVKVRGWISDIAMSERLATLGYRLDHTEVLAVNVETPPPPPAPPSERNKSAPAVPLELQPEPATQPEGDGVSGG